MHVDVHNRKQVTEMAPDPTKCLISISSPTVGHPFLDPKYDQNIPTTGWKDVLELCFHDVTQVKETEPYIPFNEQMAEQVINFVEANQGHDFVVHCDAGASRSVAIAVFLNEAFEYSGTLHATGTVAYQNRLVVDTLTRLAKSRKDEQETS